MSPVVGFSSASSSRMTVDLPEPVGPIRKTNSPLSILMLMLSSAGRADDLYCLLTWSRVIITARQCSGGFRPGRPSDHDGGAGTGPGAGGGGGGAGGGGGGPNGGGNTNGGSGPNGGGGDPVGDVVVGVVVVGGVVVGV